MSDSLPSAHSLANPNGRPTTRIRKYASLLSAANSTQPQLNGRGGSYITPPMANGRRMTSNPVSLGLRDSSLELTQQVHPTQSPHSILQSNQSSLSLNGYNGPEQGHGTPGQGQAQYGGQQGVNGQSGSAAAMQHAPRPPSAPPTTYPWSTRPLRLFAPQTSPPIAPQSPFPRYGLSVPGFPSHSGHMLIFGGLVHENVRNDLWSMDVRDCTTMSVKTKGDSPMPRVGHASAIADRIMIVWGGDTKVKPEDKQDEGLYILDLRTQEWTQLPVQPGPVGRYGHAVTMHDTKFYVFGGQAEGAFMNDLWSYDIRQLSGNGQHVWERVQFSNQGPPKRTGHIMAANGNRLFVFGGTDGSYHYNDTWAMDIATGEWSELSCIGYIPVPREGHAAAIVDDVIYTFGGRDVNGKDLGDLAAFRITNQRWYMFQNMGPAPTPRSGHAMVAAHGKIFVVGGEANASSAVGRDDPSLVHVLDTLKIKYPPDQPRSGSVKSRPSDAPSEKPDRPGVEQPLHERAVNLPSGSSPPKPTQTEAPITQRGIQPSGSMDSLAQTASPPMSTDRLASMSQSPPGQQSDLPASHPTDLGPVVPVATGGPPQRPKREGDEEYRRAMSPPNGPPSPVNQTNRVVSPSNPTSPVQQNVKNGFNASILGTRSPSPRMRMHDGERPAPPADAFYYGRSPTANGFSNRPGSITGSNELVKDLKAKDAELDAGKKREAALRVIISKAIQQGFVADDLDGETSDADQDGDEDLVGKLTDALVRLKHEKADIQNDLAAQVRQASDKAMEAERLRRGALQEAAFYRAKVATMEANAPNDVNRMDKERISELERQLGSLAADHANSQRSMQRKDSATESALTSPRLDKDNEAIERAEEAEEAHRLAVAELTELQTKHTAVETSLRELNERFITTSSQAQQREAERDHYRSQLDEAHTTREEHLGVIEQAQAAILKAGARTVEVEGLHQKATSRIRELETELAEAKADVETKSRDAQLANERLAEVEAASVKSREEADSLRSVTTGRLGDLLDSHRSLRSDEARTLRGHQEQVRALEEEGSSLRKMLREAGQRVDAAESGVSTHRDKARELELSLRTVKTEMRSHKGKLASAIAELAKYKELQGARDAELRDREMAATELETRVTVLRNLLAHHGIAVNDAELNEGESPDGRDLEVKLRDRTRAHEASQREIEELTRRCHEAEDKVESLGRLVDRIKDARSPTAMSARSPTPPGDDPRRADYEAKLAELESRHQEKVKQVESDYQTAVRYVKGSEKMLKRMKDELNKQKTANQTLQGEIDSLSGRSSTEPGFRTRDATSGRATPTAIDGEVSRRLQSLQSQHTALQAELAASREVLAAREREVELMRMRVDEAEREVETLRDELGQAQNRITTLLEMGQPGFDVGSEDGRRDSLESSDEASMAFDKFSKELKQWRGSEIDAETDDDDTAQYNFSASNNAQPQQQAGAAGTEQAAVGAKGHKRTSSEYSGDWAQ